MASKIEVVQYICDQMSGAGTITYKKMFGDYGIYCNGKFIGVICDDSLFVKETAAGAAVLQNVEEASPYEGAKLHFLVENVDDRELLTALIKATYNELPEPKHKKGK